MQAETGCNLHVIRMYVQLAARAMFVTDGHSRQYALDSTRVSQHKAERMTCMHP